MSVKIISEFKSLYNSATFELISLESDPTTMRSGFKKSSRAAPSLKNSGLETTLQVCFVNIFLIFHEF